MHTYRKAEGGNGWCVGFQQPDDFRPVAAFDTEADAAAFASFLNGGRYSPGEIAHIFAVPVDEVDDDSTYPRPQGMDYEPEAARK